MGVLSNNKNSLSLCAAHDDCVYKQPPASVCECRSNDAVNWLPLPLFLRVNCSHTPSVQSPLLSSHLTIQLILLLLLSPLNLSIFFLLPCYDSLPHLPYVYPLAYTLPHSRVPLPSNPSIYTLHPIPVTL